MEPTVHHTKFYYSRLPESKRRIYQCLLDGLSGGICTVTLRLSQEESRKIGTEELHDILVGVVFDNPHLFHLDTSLIHYSWMGRQVTVWMDQIYAAEEYQRNSRELSRLLAQITSRLNRCKTVKDKLWLIHSFLSGIMRYDDGGSSPRRQLEAHTIVGAVLYRSCVCDGYAKLFCLLCQIVGIPCAIIAGDSTQPEHMGRHAWNLVKIDGRYYHVDATWDSNIGKDLYYLRSDDFFALEHQWDRSIYPPAPADYPRQEPLITDAQALEACIFRCVEKGESTLLVQLSRAYRGLTDIQKQLNHILERHAFRALPISGYEIRWYDRINYAEITLK